MLRMVLKLILFLALALVVLAAAGLAFLRFWPSVGSLPDRAERAQLERRSAHYAGGTFQNEHEITTMTGSADPSGDRKKPCAMLPAVTPEIDVLFVSHDHYDHLDYRTIRALKDRVGAFVVPLGIDAILRGWGVEAEKIRALDWWESVELGGVTFTLTPAQHFSGRNPLKANSTLWGGMYADNGLHRVYYTGDGGYYEVFSEVRERLGAPELMLAECGQYDSAWASDSFSNEFLKKNCDIFRFLLQYYMSALLILMLWRKIRMHSCKTRPFVRVLSLLLAVTLLAGMLTVAASAASLDNVRHYDVYVCLGDSVAEGFGPDYQDYVGLKRADHAYHAYVADAVTADAFYPMARPGGSTGEVRFYLDNDYAYNSADFRIPLDEETATALRAEVQKAVANADLITLNVGSNDLFTTSLFAVAAVLYADSGIPEDLQNMLSNYGEMGKAFQSMLVTAEKLGRLPEVLRTFTEKITEGFNTFRTNWNAICKSIYALNPDVTLVAVGFFNPVRSLRLSSTQPQIGQMMDPIAHMLNTFVRYQADYARQYLFADVYNTECYELVPVDDPTFGSTLVPAVHPTHEGHKYMAQQIVKVLPEKEEPKPCDGGANCPSKAFTDVDRSADSWMHEPIDWAVTNKITTGTGANTFSPDAECTRAQAVTFLYRMAGEPAVTTTENPFLDVKADDYFCKAVLWAVENGVTKGTASDAFSPDKTCTRAEIATFLFRFAKAEPLEGADNPFSDVPAGAWYTDAVLWAADQGIAQGVGGGKFAPDNACTRAQIVTFLFRAQ